MLKIVTKNFEVLGYKRSSMKFQPKGFQKSRRKHTLLDSKILRVSMRVPHQFIPRQESFYFSHITADYIGNILLHFLGLDQICCGTKQRPLLITLQKHQKIQTHCNFLKVSDMGKALYSMEKHIF